MLIDLDYSCAHSAGEEVCKNTLAINGNTVSCMYKEEQCQTAAQPCLYSFLMAISVIFILFYCPAMIVCQYGLPAHAHLKWLCMENCRQHNLCCFAGHISAVYSHYYSFYRGIWMYSADASYSLYIAKVCPQEHTHNATIEPGLQTY